MFGFRKSPGKGVAQRAGRAVQDAPPAQSVQSARSAELGVALVALRLRGEGRLPDGCVELVFDTAGRARRAPARYAGAGETACAYHPGPYETAFAPFAGAPEIGLRLRYVADAADPRVAQQRFELFLYSEGGDALTVDALHGAIASAVRSALAQGRLDLPACTTLEEWHAFRAGLNELLYTRFGLTVDDCVPVDLGEVCDYAAILRERVAHEAAPDASAVMTVVAVATAAATAGVSVGSAEPVAPAGGAAMDAVSVGSGAPPAPPSVSASVTAHAAQARQGATPSVGIRREPVLGEPVAPGARRSAQGGDGPFGTTNAKRSGLPTPDRIGHAPLGAAGTATGAASVPALAATTGAAALATAAGTAAAAGTATGAADAPVHAAVISAATSPAPVAAATLAPETAIDAATRRAATPARSAASATIAGPGTSASCAGKDPAAADAHALRRLFLELPAWSAGVRALALPEGPSLFTTRRDMLQRCALAALDVNTMPSLAWAAPDRPLAKQGQTRRMGHSMAAVQALDEAWALLAQWQLATACGAGAEVHAALLDEADRLVANLAFHLAGRRTVESESVPDGERREPQW